MSYIFESKRDLLYFRNYLALKNAIEHVGGSGDFVIKKCGEELLDTLTKNGIELNFKCPEIDANAL